MPETPLSLGGRIEARCTKCRKNTEHIIVSMIDESADKVLCTACQREHKFKPPVATKTPAEKSLIRDKESKRRQGESDRKQWNALRPEFDAKKAKDYSMTEAYKVNSLINHPTFGLGYVQRVIGCKKMDVLFEDGKKILRCK